MRRNDGRERRVDLSLPMIFAVALLPLAFISLVRYNPTPSMPVGFYLRVPGKPQEGDLVEAVNPMDPSYLGVCASVLVKHVDHVTPEGLYWLRGDSPRSFDSRYFGAVGDDLVRFRLVLLCRFGWLAEEAGRIARRRAEKEGR